jgi:ribosomal protein L25 (general stress protein Ctc)
MVKLGDDMDKYIIVLLILAFVSQPVFAATYIVEVQVSDSSARPIQGASLVFKCMEHFGDWFTDPEDVPRSWPLRDTDSSGSATIDTYGQCTAGLDSSIVANYKGLSVTIPVSLHSGTNKISVVIEGLEDLTVIVQDQDSNPIKDVEVGGTPVASGSVPSISGTTDENGIVVFKQVPSAADFLLRLKNGYEEKTMEADLANQGTSYSVNMSTYTVTASVVDDLDKPIGGAILNVSSGSSYSSALTDSGGKAVFRGLKSWNYTIAMAYNNRQSSAEVKVDSDIEKKFIMDIHGPSITNMRTEAKSSKEPVYVLANVADNNSGLKYVKMYYSFNQVSWIEIPVSLTGDGTNRGTVPAQPKGTRISYKVASEDNAGNPSEQGGYYTVQDAVCPFAAAFLALPSLAVWHGRKRH